jgi:hypothetical protein
MSEESPGQDTRLEDLPVSDVTDALKEDSATSEDVPAEQQEYMENVAGTLQTLERSARAHHGISLQPDQVQTLFTWIVGLQAAWIEAQQMAERLTAELEAAKQKRSRLWRPGN